MKIKLKRWLNRMLGRGCCYKCGTAWYSAEPHCTTYERSDSATRGCFPLCKSCWGGMKISERLPFYESLCADWGALPGSVKYEAIMLAVRGGE